MQETKLNPNEEIVCGALVDYQVYYQSRQLSQGGGIALGIDKQFESVFVRGGNDDLEIMSVVFYINNLAVRVLVGYGPQENDSKEKKDAFWNFLDTEVVEAELEGQGLVIQFDGNLHAGQDLIKNDPNPQNQNGRLFMQFLQRHSSVSVVNSWSSFEGLLTRKRVTKDRTEEAVLDFFIVNDRLQSYVKRAFVDEDKEYALWNFSQQKKNMRVIASDHNALVMEVAIKFSRKKPERLEMFNLKNKAGQEEFKNRTEVNVDLVNCFQNEMSVADQGKRWFKKFNSVLHSCFKKVRICNNVKKTNHVLNNLITKRNDLQKAITSLPYNAAEKDDMIATLEAFDLEIGDVIGKQFLEDIAEVIKSVGGDEKSLDGAGRQSLWKLLRKKSIKCQPQVPIGKLDKNKQIVTNHEGLKGLYINTYLERLENRPIMPGFEELKELKMMLFSLRLTLCSYRKSEEWTINDLEIVLSSLKNNKARDPNGWINEIFKSDVAGNDLKLSMLHLFNQIKSESSFPDFMKNAEVTSLYKGKGSKNDLGNDRGIFIVSIFRTILMKLMYKDVYDDIDESMSDSQIGSRKNKNIRNHIWVVNSVIHDVLRTKKKKPIDIIIYDYKQCFDGLWLEETLNDLYDGGLNDDKFNLLHSANKSVELVIKTPIGKTNKGTIHNVVMQGDVFGPLLCSKQVDTFGKECIEENKYSYLYKNEVVVPPLSMMDDLISISECGHKTAMAHAYLCCKSNTKKLSFGVAKCKKLHVGKIKDDYKCQSLTVEIVEPQPSDRNIEVKVGASKVSTETIDEVAFEKYLGDIISIDGNNIQNIKSRVNKGRGIIARIMQILESNPMGKLYFEVAVVLRNSLFVSSVLCNSEAWFNVTKAQLQLLESVDVLLLRKILDCPQSTPKEMLYLELGVQPLGDIMQQRRLNFLFYILQQKPDSLLYKMFEKQIEDRSRKDWVSTVLSDLDELNLVYSFEQIQKMSKIKWMNIVKQNSLKHSFYKLELMKEKHSKVSSIKHETFKMQKYLAPNEEDLLKSDMQMIFKMRCKVIKLKMNMKSMYEEYECRVCRKENETQEHIYQCKKIFEYRETTNKMKTDYEKIENGSVSEQREVMKIFKEQMKTLEIYVERDNL